MAIRMREYADDVVSIDYLSGEAPPADDARLEPTIESIAAEAYAIYETRGREDGRDLEDWLEAERRLLERMRNGVDTSN